MNHQNTSIPTLIIDNVFPDEKDSKRLIGNIRIGGHPITVILDFRYRDMGFIEHVQLPGLLSIHPPTQKVVIELMTRVYDKEIIKFPIDLSEEIRNLSPLSPFNPISPDQREILEADADKVKLELYDIAQESLDPKRLSCKFILDGQHITLNVELYSGKGRIPVIRWLSDEPSPENFSAAQLYAIQRALLHACGGLDQN